jgi:chromosome segregation ATPase
MDKRKQFQVQILSGKLAEYTNKLETLKKERTQLLDTIQYEAKDTTTEINKTAFLEKKGILESQIQNYKNNLARQRAEYTRLQHQIKSLPSQLETAKQQENDIYNEELFSIAGRSKEAEQQYLATLDSLKLEKLDLEAQIEVLQSQIQDCQYNITSIQESAHASRKNTIAELQQQKQQKVALATALDKLNETKNIYETHNQEIASRLDKLQSFKSSIINDYYNNSANATSSNITILATARDIIPEDLIASANNPNEIMNIVIAYLDKQIAEAQYQLSNISRKNARLDITIATTSSGLKNQNQLVNPYRREKPASFKDNYKNAKEEKASLEAELYRLLEKKNSWNTVIIGGAECQYNAIMESLAAEELRAHQRLDIITSRLNQDHEANLLITNENIKHIERDLAITNKLILEAKQELAMLNDDIAKNNSTQLELDKIHNQISNLEVAIAKIQGDITSLCS